MVSRTATSKAPRDRRIGSFTPKTLSRPRISFSRSMHFRCITLRLVRRARRWWLSTLFTCTLLYQPERRIRLGLGLTFVLGAAAGIVIAARGGPYIGSDLGRLHFFGWSMTGGDLRPAHFLGIHAMQLLPLAGAVIAWAGGGRRLIFAAAFVYCAVTVAVFALALQGIPLISGGFA